MKYIFFLFLTITFITSFGQNRRSIRFNTFAKDSINLHLDENYFLIEDTCSSIIRYGHFRFKDRKFFGPFRDLNKLDPQIVLAEGNYTQDGLLDGDMKLFYLNGDSLAIGKYDKGEMVGDWTIYYAGNKKKLEFNKISETIVLNAWDETGKQTLTNGTGFYRSDIGGYYWEGKLINSKPDGTWKLKETGDRTGTVVSSETFKAGNFVKGGGPMGNYTDKSRILLAGNNLLPINNAGLMEVSKKACDPSMMRKKIVYASYRNGTDAFNEEIKRVIAPVFAKLDLKKYFTKEFTLIGSIDEGGRIFNLKYQDTFDDKASTTLIRALYTLPILDPTLVDGISVQSRISFKFIFRDGLYSFQWRLLPLEMPAKM
ncbi:hypothetical protein SAMN05421813_106140 [Daejeonella rubra]|uniref:MORN repeat variant n=1 Tax=Daejeonella rubra TaxID=990371 RepID=A0A1G9QPQ4_9SPHI|nr:hypothetical protein [Daejeonella rubra]SDM12840.1 hypothetical protein SAMN05421813_106140 [Daejeonella rubra]